MENRIINSYWSAAQDGEKEFIDESSKFLLLSDILCFLVHERGFLSHLLRPLEKETKELKS